MSGVCLKRLILDHSIVSSKRYWDQAANANVRESSCEMQVLEYINGKEKDQMLESVCQMEPPNLEAWMEMLKTSPSCLRPREKEKDTNFKNRSRSCRILVFRLLPPNHFAKEDKLEVKKMIIHAVDKSLRDLSGEEYPEPEEKKTFKGGKKKANGGAKGGVKAAKKLPRSERSLEAEVEKKAEEEKSKGIVNKTLEDLPPSEKSWKENSKGIVNPIDKALEDLPPTEKKFQEAEGVKRAKIVKTYVRKRKRSKEINAKTSLANLQAEKM